jgi:hypothetical protein
VLGEIGSVKHDDDLLERALLGLLLATNTENTGRYRRRLIDGSNASATSHPPTARRGA